LHLRQEDFNALNVQILGISADQPFSQKAFSRQLGLTFPLLSDRSGEVLRAYGLFDEERKAARRAYVLIDTDRKELWRHVMENPTEALDVHRLLETVSRVLQP
jgi:peroxiredoxin Q/BCP